jgi:hypothetical protein
LSKSRFTSGNSQGVDLGATVEAPVGLEANVGRDLRLMRLAISPRKIPMPVEAVKNR